jgi:hypothetical protein
VFQDILIDGKDEDLSAFGCDFSEWQEVSIAVADQIARVNLNGREIRTIRYNQDLGQFAGARFLFTGSGMIDNIQLADSVGNVVYSNSFEN